MENIKKMIRLSLPEKLVSRLTNIYLKLKFSLFGPKSFKPHPLHKVKIDKITEFGKLVSYRTLIETGTYMGDMVEAQKDQFDKVISIELAPHLAKAAEKRFKHDNNVQIIEGDSATVLSEIVSSLTDPAIYWLDGHYSAGITAKGETECPIYGELRAILADTKNHHVILIDDAGLFNGTGDYPNIDDVKAFILEKNPRYKIGIEDNIICCF